MNFINRLFGYNPPFTSKVDRVINHPVTHSSLLWNVGLELPESRNKDTWSAPYHTHYFPSHWTDLP